MYAHPVPDLVNIISFDSTNCNRSELYCGVKMKRIIVILTLIFYCTILQGCTYRAWYTSFQEEQRNKCYDNLNQSQIQQCLDRANMSYDDYEKYRKETTKQTP